MKTKFATPVMIVCILALAMNTGAGIYQHMFGIPQMLSSPDSMKAYFHSDSKEPQLFWIPLHIISLFSLIFSLVLNWMTRRRKALIIALYGLVYVDLISMYFSKLLFGFPNLTNLDEFHRQTTLWLDLSWHRLAVMLISEILLLIALSKPVINVESK